MSFTELFDYKISSSALDSDVSIEIDGEDYATGEKGLNIVIYNKNPQLIVDARTFYSEGFQNIRIGVM